MPNNNGWRWIGNKVSPTLAEMAVERLNKQFPEYRHKQGTPSGVGARPWMVGLYRRKKEALQ